MMHEQMNLVKHFTKMYDYISENLIQKADGSLMMLTSTVYNLFCNILDLRGVEASNYADDDLSLINVLLEKVKAKADVVNSGIIRG